QCARRPRRRRRPASRQHRIRPQLERTGRPQATCRILRRLWPEGRDHAERQTPTFLHPFQLGRNMGLTDQYRSTGDLPGVIPVFPLAGAILLPRGQLPLNIFEPRYLKMIADAMRGERIIGMVQPDGEAAILASQMPGERPPLCAVGCAGRITSWAETGD